MKFVSCLFLLAGTALAGKEAATTSCKGNPSMVSKFKACSTGSAFCQTFITPSTVIATSTTTLTQVTTTATVSETTSSYAEGTDTVYVATTVTTTYTSTSYTTKATCPASAHAKRAPAATPTGSCKIPPSAPRSAVSQACNCVFGTTTTTTKTATQGTGGTETTTTTLTSTKTLPGSTTVTRTETEYSQSVTVVPGCATPPSCRAGAFYLRTTKTGSQYTEGQYIRVDGYLAYGYGEMIADADAWLGSGFTLDKDGLLWCGSCNNGAGGHRAFVLHPNKDSTIKFAAPGDTKIPNQIPLKCRWSADGVLGCSADGSGLIWLKGTSVVITADDSVPSNPDPYSMPWTTVELRARCYF